MYAILTLIFLIWLVFTIINIIKSIVKKVDQWWIKSHCEDLGKEFTCVVEGTIDKITFIPGPGNKFFVYTINLTHNYLYQGAFDGSCRDFKTEFVKDSFDTKGVMACPKSTYNVGDIIKYNKRFRVMGSVSKDKYAITDVRNLIHTPQYPLSLCLEVDRDFVKQMIQFEEIHGQIPSDDLDIWLRA